MDQKGNTMDKTGLKLNLKKGQKFWTTKTCFLAEIFLAELGGIPSPLAKISQPKKALRNLGVPTLT